MANNDKASVVIDTRQTIIPLGLDDGHRNSKLVMDSNNLCIIDSQAQAGEQSQISFGRGQKSVYQYKVGHQPFIVGKIQEAMSTNFNEYPTSELNRAIVTHALRQLKLDMGQKVAIVTGLPLKRFYRGKAINQTLIEAKRQSLLKNDVVEVVYGPHGSEISREHIPTIVKHEVLPEGVAAWMDYVIDYDSQGNTVKNADKYNQKVGIVDIGGRTTNLLVMESSNIDFARSDTKDLGGLNIEKAVAEEIYANFGFVPSLLQLNRVMMEHKLEVWGKEEDVSDIVTRFEEIEAQNIVGAIRSVFKNAADLKKVLFVGGTTLPLRKYLTGLFPQEEFHANPQYANGFGMQKFAKLTLV